MRIIIGLVVFAQIDELTCSAISMIRNVAFTRLS